MTTDHYSPAPTELPADAPAESSAATEPPKVDWSLPSWERSPRLEDVLGTRLATVDWSHLEGLVERQVPEDRSIDFKLNWYALNREVATEVLAKHPREEWDERIAKSRRDLAKDVSAFANASGGLVVLGVADMGGRASGLLGVELSEKRRLALSDVVRDLTTPYIPGVEVGVVRDPDDDSRGCVLVYVPASAGAPHAVVEPNAVRYSWVVRDGAKNVPLHEPQVATAYRDRFMSRASNEEEARTVFDDGVAGLDRLDRCWLAVAVSPSQRGVARPLGRQIQEEFREATKHRQDYLPDKRLGDQAGFGRGRVVLRESSETFAPAKDHLLHLYTDGRAFAAAKLPTLIAGGEGSAAFEYREDLEAGTVGIVVDSLTSLAVKLLGTAVGHVVDAGGSGELEVQCSIVTAKKPREGFPASAKLPLASVPHVVVNQQVEVPLARVVTGARAVEHVQPLQLTVSPSLSVDSRELLTVTAQVVSELVAEFGVLPTYPMLTPDGLVVSVNCRTPLGQWLADWAAKRNLLAGHDS